MAAPKRAALQETIKKDMESRDILKPASQRPKQAPDSVQEDQVKEYKGFTVRLTAEQYQAAKRYFDSKGIPLAVGARSAILDYLRGENAI